MSTLSSSRFIMAAAVTLVVAGVSSSPAQQLHARDTLRLDLSRVVEIALQNATPVQLGSDTLRLTGIALLESYGRFLPNVSATVGGFNQQGYTLLSSTALAPADAQFYGLGYTLSASLNLFNGFRDREHLRASLQSRDAASNSLDRARQQVAFDVSQAYYQLVLDRRLLSVAQGNLELSRARESQLAEQVRIGTKAPPDLYRQQAQARADEVAVIDAQNRVQNDETAVLTRIRVDATRPYTFAEPAVDTARLSPTDLDLDTVLRRALAARPDLISAQNKASADEHDMQLARGELLPQLALRFDYAGNGRVFGHEVVDGKDQLTIAQRSVTQQLTNQHYGQLSLGLSWNLFDGYKGKFDIERATVLTDRDRLTIEDLRLKIGADVQSAILNYRSAEQKLVATAAGLEAAQQAYDAVQGRFDVGLASIVDVLAAQTALTQARALREQSLTNMALQKAVLRYATGEQKLN